MMHRLIRPLTWLALPLALIASQPALAWGEYAHRLSGRIALAPFVTHTMGLSGNNHAFDLMHQGESIRSVVHFEGDA